MTLQKINNKSATYPLSAWVVLCFGNNVQAVGQFFSMIGFIGHPTAVKQAARVMVNQ
jgi:hypothetical protein